MLKILKMAVFFLHTMFPQIFSGLPFVLLHILSPERTAFGFFNLIQVKNQCLTVYIPALWINDLCKLLYNLCPPYTAVTAIQITMFPLKIARKVLKEPEKKSLDALCGYFSIVRDHAHRAVDDARATAELYLLLKAQYQEQEPGLFCPKEVHLHIKKQGPLTPAQKRDLNHLMIYHRIESDIEIDSLTKSEASRMIDKIYAKYGRIPKQEVSDNV